MAIGAKDETRYESTVTTAAPGGPAAGRRHYASRIRTAARRHSLNDQYHGGEEKTLETQGGEALKTKLLGRP